MHASVSPGCYALGGSLGRGRAEIVCTPSRTIYTIQPRVEPLPEPEERVLPWEEPAPLHYTVQNGTVYTDQQLELQPPLIQDDPEEPSNEITFTEVLTLEEVCLQNGCTVEEISDTHINILGGPPDKNVVSGVFDSLFSVGTWLAQRWFAMSF